MNITRVLSSAASVSHGLRRLLPVLIAITAIVILAIPMFSQTANGRIAGTVKDQSGGAIVSAAVIVTDVARGLTRNLTTDEAGAYLAPNLLPGNYSVRATFTGFQAWERTNIALGVGGDLFIDVTLVPGAQTQTVTITEELPLVNTTSATLGGALSNEIISDLPLNGRNFTLLLDLRPGVVLTLGNNSGGTGAASVNGLRSDQSNEYMVEGLHAFSPFHGQPIMNSIPVSGDAGSLLPVDAIQEFNQQFNSKAEYGWKAGGAINIGLKSGTNAVHGSGYAFFRRDALDARQFFNLAATQPKVNSSLNQWGGTLGAPIKKDKLFFFLGFEQQRLSVGSPSSTNVPFTAIANQDGSPMLNCVTTPLFSCTPVPNSVAGTRTPDASNHVILACLGLKNSPAPNNVLSPLSLSLVGLNSDCSPGATYPNATNGSTWFVPHGGDDHGATANTALGINTYFPNAQSTALVMGGVVKADYQLNAKNSVSGFLFGGPGNNTAGSNQVNPLWRTHVLTYPLMVAGTWTWLPNSSWANSFRVGYASLENIYVGFDTESEITSAQVGLPTGVNTFLRANGGFPQSTTLTGFNAIGSRQTQFDGPSNSIELSDQVNYLRGQHSIKFGGTIMTNHQNGGIWAFTKGTFVFGQSSTASESASGLISFLAGQNPIPRSVDLDGAGPIAAVTFPGDNPTFNSTGLESASLFYGNPESHVRRMVYSLFVQDDWRVHPRLTLNLGLRYDLTSVIHDRDYILGSFDPNIGIIQEGIQRQSLYNPDHNNFAPRLGVAWDVRGNGKTVVRAGGSIVYELVILRSYLEVGNSPALAGNPTAWVTGCTVPTGTMSATTGLVTPTVNPAPAGSPLVTNCQGLGGSLITPGGSQNVGLVNWSRSGGNILNIVQWDNPPGGSRASIFPGSALNNCSPFITVRDNPAFTTARAGARCPIVSVDPKLRTPYVETWTLSMQHAFANNLVLDVAYVGNHGTLQIGRTDDNQPLPGSGWTPALIAACTATPTFTPSPATCNGNGTTSNNLERISRPFHNKFTYLDTITRVWNAHTSNYNGLQMTLTARNFHGFSTNVGYTYAKALDITNDHRATVGTDSYNVSLDYGRSGSDLRHRFTLAPSYSFPAVMGYYGLLNGWKINGVFRYQTGQPWAPAATNDFQGSGRSTRWDFFGDTSDFVVDYHRQNFAIFHPAGHAVPTPISSGTDPQRPGTNYVASDLAINTPLCKDHARSLHTLQVFGCWTQGNSVVTPPPVNSFGNMRKGLFDGARYWSADMNVTKRQQITERLTSEFRAEFFNVLNHPAFSGPATGLGCTSATCNLGLVSNTPDVAAGNSVLGTGGPRRIQFGVKLIF